MSHFHHFFILSIRLDSLVSPMPRPRPTKPSRHPSASIRPAGFRFQISPDVSVQRSPASPDRTDRPLLHSSPPLSPVSLDRTWFETFSSYLRSTSILPIISIVLLVAVTTPYLFSIVPHILHLQYSPSLFNSIESHPGVSIVSACTNRHSVFARSFASWLRVPLVQQILIIDWGSAPPLKDTVDAVLDVHTADLGNKSATSVSVIRVNGESNWVPSRAYNLAARLATYDTLFKVDCDVLVNPSFIASHPMADGQRVFYAGHHALARSANDFTLESVMLISRNLFLSVGGYDERIQTFGYESDDLYSRLNAKRIDRLNTSQSLLTHIMEHDINHVQSSAVFPHVQAGVNRALLDHIGHPWTTAERSSQYLRDAIGSDALRATYVPPSIESLVPAGVALNLRTEATKDRLYQRHRVPRAIIESMVLPTAEKALRSLDMWSSDSQGGDVSEVDTSPPLAIIHVQNGIGNRLRVLGSGMAFAELTNRVPILIWEPDVHFGARFDELFNTSHVHFPVLENFNAQWPLQKLAKDDPSWNRFSFYNYMLDRPDRPTVKDEPGRSVYFVSSSIMNSNVTSWESENQHILSLVVRDDISNLIKTGLAFLKEKRVAGVHIRNRSLDHDIPGVGDNHRFYHKRDMELIDKW